MCVICVNTPYKAVFLASLGFNGTFIAKAFCNRQHCWWYSYTKMSRHCDCAQGRLHPRPARTLENRLDKFSFHAFACDICPRQTHEESLPTKGNPSPCPVRSPTRARSETRAPYSSRLRPLPQGARERPRRRLGFIIAFMRLSCPSTFHSELLFFCLLIYNI